MASRKSAQAQPAQPAPAPVAPEGDDFDAIVARAEAAIAAREAATPLAERIAPEQVEIVRQPTPAPAPKPGRAKKEATAVAKQPGTSLSPVSKPAVREPARTEIRETINLMGVAVPFSVLLSNRTLSELEAVVTKGIEAVFAVGQALTEIKVRELWREAKDASGATYKDFDAYVRARWDMGKSRSGQMIDANKTVQRLTAANVPAAQMPKNEAAARELKVVAQTGSDEQVREVTRLATSGGTQAMTAQSAADATSQVMGTAKRTTSSDTTANRAAQKAGNAPAAPATPSAATAGVTALARGPVGSAQSSPTPVGATEGRVQLEEAIMAFKSGRFLRTDTADLGTVALVRTLRQMCEAWLAGSKNFVEKPATKQDKPVVDKVLAAIEARMPAPADPRRKGESAADFAKRVNASPEAFKDDVVQWAKDIAKVPATKAEAEARAAAAGTPAQGQPAASAATESAAAPAAPAPKGRARKSPAVPAAPAVSAEAQAMADATVAARPETGTQQRRRAAKQTAA
ncbi:MAG TPA: hypothetical protein VE953_12005 [Terriglobales bacterium]|nr:hypothetical protein [Terriglobales bacterium]